MAEVSIFVLLVGSLLCSVCFAESCEKQQYTSPCPSCSGNFSLGDLDSVEFDSGELKDRPMLILREDQYSLGTFYYGTYFSIRRFILNEPVETFLGNENQRSKKYTAGNSSTAEFSPFINDFLQYDRTTMIIADFGNNCIRKYDFETDYVSEFIGDCDGTHTPGELLASDVLNATSNFLSGPISIELIKSRNMLIMCDFGYRILSQYNFLTNKVQLLGADLNSLLPNPSYLLKNADETGLYVSHSYGISRVELATLEVVRIAGHAEHGDADTHIPFVPGPLDEAKIGLINSMRWIIQDKLMVTLGTESNEVLIFVDLENKQIYGSCADSEGDNATVTGPLATCELNAPTAIEVGTDGTIYIATPPNGIPLTAATLPSSNSSLYLIPSRVGPCNAAVNNAKSGIFLVLHMVAAMLFYLQRFL